MPRPRSRTARRRSFAVATAAFTLLFAGAGVTAQRKNADAQERIEEHLVRLRADREAADYARPALWGETEEGPAWPHYQRAFAALNGLSDASPHDFVAALLVDASDGERALRESLLDRFAPALGHVRKGAHMRDAEVVIAWEQGVEARIPKLVESRVFHQIAAMLLLEAETVEQEVEAVRFLLDAQQLGADLAHSRQVIVELIGASIVVAPALGPHLESGLLSRLSREAKVEWLRGLRRLEVAVRPESRALHGELETFAQAFVLHPSNVRVEPQGALERWRNALLLRPEVAEHLDLVAAALPRIEEAYGSTGPGLLGQMRAIEDELHASGNRITQRMAHLPRSHATARLRTRAHLSLLRRALELHLGLEGKEPADVFGTGVQIDVDGDTIRLATEWTEGGRDHGEVVVEFGDKAAF